MILKYIALPAVANGMNVEYHAPGGALLSEDSVTVTVFSWVRLEDFTAQREPDARTVVVFGSDFDVGNPEQSLATHPESPLIGGDVRSVPDPASSLSDLKAAKNAAINAARLRANQSHFVFAGKQIAVDPLSRSDIDAAHGAILMLGAMPGGWPGGWKAMDNTILPIPDLATWGQFYGAMVAQGTSNFNHAQALKAQLAAATTPEEVEAVPVW
jgi:hypothetical protein